MEHYRDEATEAMLGEVIAEGTDVIASFFNDVIGQEELGEEEGYVHDGSGPLMPVQEEGYVHDGSGDPMEVQEETVLTAPVTEPSLARYIYIS